jgi:cytochrome c
VAGVTLTVDGLPVGSQLDGVALGLGAHELAATASDKAGNTSVTKVPFIVVVSYAEAAKLVDRYRAANKVPLATATVLKTQLAVAEQQQRRGRDALAAIALDLFIAKARTVQDVPARTLLISVGQDLKARL